MNKEKGILGTGNVIMGIRVNILPYNLSNIFTESFQDHINHPCRFMLHFYFKMKPS